MKFLPTVKFATRATLLLALLPPAFSTASAQARHDPEPEVLQTPSGTTEVGTLNATPYRIDLPPNWLANPRHGLIVYFHGYAERPVTYRITAPLPDQVQPLFERGYAVLQSAYSAPGWALAEAYPDTERLRQYFLKRYAQPALGKNARKDGSLETIAVGVSMGGAMVAVELELNPKPYAGGLDLCGSVGPTDLALQRRFSWVAAFDFFFPGLLPPIDPVPADYEESRAFKRRLEDALRAKPSAAAAMRSLTALHTDHDLADAISYFIFVIGDMQRRARGNPFDNRNVIYSGTDPSSTVTDNALNDGVRRFTADLRARDYLLHHYTPTGQLHQPMLALHTTYDPRIPTPTLSIYAEQVAIAGFSQNLVQQYVRHDGHCTFTQDEVGRTFDELLLWIHTGRRPPAGILPTPPPARPGAPLIPRPLNPLGSHDLPGAP